MSSRRKKHLAVAFRRNTIISLALVALSVPMLSVSAAGDSAWQNHAKLGQTAFEAKNYKLAIEECSQALKQYKSSKPDSQPYVYCLRIFGLSLMREKRFKESESVFKEVTDLAAVVRVPEVIAMDLDNLASVYRMMGRYSEAEPILKKAITIIEKAFGDSSPKLGDLLLNLARTLKYQGKQIEAEQVYERDLHIADANKDFDPETYPALLNSIANFYNTTNRIAQAEALYKKALALDEKQYGANSPNLVVVLCNLGFVQLKLDGKAQDGEVNLRRAIELLARASESELPDAVTLSRLFVSLADLEIESNNFDKAKILLMRAEKAIEPLGDLSPELSVVLMSQGNMQKQQGRLDEAEKSYVRAVVNATKGNSETYFASACRKLGRLYLLRNDLVKAEPYLESAENVAAKSTRLQTKTDAALMVNKLSRRLRLYFQKDRFSDVEKEAFSAPDLNGKSDRLVTLKRLIDLREKQFGADDPSVAEAKLQLGLCLESMGADGEKLQDEAYMQFDSFLLKVNQIVQGKKPTPRLEKQIASLGGLEKANKFIADASLCCAFADKSAGRTRGIRASNAYVICLTDRIKDTVWRIDNLLLLSKFYSDDYWEFSRSSLEAAQTAAETYGKPETLFQVYLAGAKQAYQQDDYAEAEVRAMAAIKIAGTTISEHDERFVECLEVLVRVNSKNPALNGLTDKLLVRARSYKQERPELLVSCLVSLTNYYLSNGNINEATKMMEECLPVCESLRQDPLAKAPLARAHLAEGRLIELRADAIGRQKNGKISSEADALYEKARRAYMKCADEFVTVSTKSILNQGYFDGLSSAARVEAKRGNEGAAVSLLNTAAKSMSELCVVFQTLSYGEQILLAGRAQTQINTWLTIAEFGKNRNHTCVNVMSWEGLLIDSVRRAAKAKSSIKNFPDLQWKFSTIQKVNERLSRLNQGGTSKDSSEYARFCMAKERLERAIARESETMTDPQTEVVHLISTIGQGEAYVDIFKYSRFGCEEPKYAAYVITSDTRKPDLIQLGSAKEIDAAVANWRTGVTGEDSKNRSLRDVSVIPRHAPSTGNSGDSQLSANQLILDKILKPIVKVAGPQIKQFWWAQRGELLKLPLNQIATGLPSTISICEVDGARELINLKRRAKKADSSKSMLAAGGITFFNDPRVQDLPKTKVEVAEIATFAKAQNIVPVILTSTAATKSAIEEAFPKASYIHLATHGFARGENNAGTSDKETRGLKLSNLIDNGKSFQSRNPLLDSGLFVSRPVASSAELNDEPGILTADELVGIDLSNCELVALSACETGLGRGMSGQGVVGLRSAIIGGGAKCVLMSLWKVDDDATRALMKEFYANLWQKKLSPIKSLAEAQNTVRNVPKWAGPKYWAGWVIAGDGF